MNSESYVLLVQWTILRGPTLLYGKSLHTSQHSGDDCLCTFLILNKAKHCNHKKLCVKLILISFRPLDMMLQCLRSLSETSFLWKKVRAAASGFGHSACPIPHTQSSLETIFCSFNCMQGTQNGLFFFIRAVLAQVPFITKPLPYCLCRLCVCHSDM